MSDGLDATLKRASSGDSSAWRDLVEMYGPRVYGLLRSRCGDPELAEELAQSVFCTVAEKIGTDAEGRYVEQGRFESWLFRIAMNRLRDEVRRRKRQAVGIGGTDAELVSNKEADSKDDGTDSPEQREESAIRVQSLRNALNELNDADREIIELRHIGGLSFKQIAELLDEPMGTVLARQHRALRKLKGMLTEYSDSCPAAE